MSPKGDVEETESPGVVLSPGLEGQGGMEVDAAGGDVSAEQSPTGQHPTYQAGFESGTGVRPPYPSASSDGHGMAASAPSDRNVYMNSTLPQSVSSSEIAIFEPKVRKGFRLDDRVYIYTAECSQCMDQCGTALVKLYAHKCSEVAKWRANWDKGTDAKRIDRALAGHQRSGHGLTAWRFGQEPTPPFRPKANAEIELQVAELLDFAESHCYVPNFYWLSETAKLWAHGLSGAQAQQPVPKDGFALDAPNEGDPRVAMVLRLVLALYDKPFCSFVVPRHADERRADCFYFPENCAFLDHKKVSGLVAAVTMSYDRQANLGRGPMEKGLKYMKTHPLQICDQAESDSLFKGPQHVRPPSKAKVRAIMPPEQEDSEMDRMD